LLSHYVGFRLHRSGYEEFYSFIILLSWVRLSQLGTAVLPKMIDDGYCRAIGGMEIRGGKPTYSEEPALKPICAPQIPHDFTLARIRAAAVGSQRLTA
jgi:hypothetical protein